MTNNNENCPHRQQLENTLLHCQTQSEILQATRDNYLSIIVEFQRDLEELTEQVEQQQQQQQQQLQHNELESRDDLEQKLGEYPQIIPHELELQNERLVCQIHSLKCDLEDREGQLQELRLVVNGYADISETNRLKDEIFRLKQKNSADQAKKIGELTKVIKDQEEERTQLCINYETLSNTSHVQSKDLDRAKRDVQSLQDRLSQVEKTQEDLKTERNLLREEIIALKEKDAISTGRERALNDELQRRQQELDKSRNLYVHLHTLKQQLEEQHKDTVSRLCQTNEDIRLQLQAVSSECKEWQNKLKKQTNLTDQHQLIIESFRMWKDAQLRADEAMRQCIKKAEDNITGLVKENNRLTEQYQRLCGDYITLENEMRRIKSAVNIRLPSGSELPEAFLRGQKVHDEMIERLQYMRLCSKRLSDQVQTVNHSPGILNQEYTLDQTTPTTTTSGQQQQPENQEEYHQLTPSKNAWQSHRPH